ncbi:hypothetical protein K1T71_003638 [Dendrolimus kikuchii]|uniref:Uncharacterized protein n=1 Tax=Dendrolimus kikuchii TaxID=765133 RepID=A0ACC1D903_9NEOP|nr:hypothetical protein K1T71_003638 [Dendrolimus kikuchii]
MEMNEQQQQENKCKQRFKGVENFLRRIAFNLGNTPSQTEVKIISCIPIDVTDLQQKIIQLERQLDGATATPKEVKEADPETRKSSTGTRKESATGSRKGSATKDTKSGKEDADAKNGKESPEAKIAKEPGPKKSTAGAQKKTSVVNTAFCDSNFDYSSTNSIRNVEYGPTHQGSLPCRDCTAKQRKSAVSFIFPAISNNGDNCMISSDDAYSDCKGKCKNDFRRNLFNIKRKVPKKKKFNKTELVYYAKTNNLASNGNNLKSGVKNNTVNRTYINDMIRKQFKLGMILEKLSDTSEFSSPVCRDENPTRPGPYSYESDVCSCCHGGFEDVDYATNMHPNQTRGSQLQASTIYDKGIYYDSSLYDVVPVKEKPVNLKRNIDCLKRKEDTVDIKCWPQNVRPKPRFQPYVVNYHTVIPTNDLGKTVRLNTKQDLKNITSKRDRKMQLAEQVNNDTSNSCCVDLGEVQTKRVNKKLITKQLSESVGPVYKNAECLTTVINNTDCQTTSFSVEDTRTFDKTEETLNNIKSILQSVLTEVKTNSQIKQSENKVKKDAVVQKGVSQTNMQGCSRLLNCLTYSPFSMNPYDATCSRQMPAGHPCCSIQQHPMKCMHNYPVFIQSPGRRRCSSCFRSSQITKCHANNVTAATNTEDIKEEHSKETEKLIKEIYRSMALTLDLPTKDTSYSNYDDLKSVRTTPVSTHTSYSQSNNNKEFKVIISEIFKKSSLRADTLRTQDTNTTLDSKFLSNSINIQSQGVSTDDTQHTNIGQLRRNFIEEDHDEDEEDDEIIDEDGDKSTATENNDKESITELQSISTTDHDSESSTNDSECENEVIVEGSVNEKKKPGLFSKMFNTMFKSKNKKETKVSIRKSESSDSEDYQTIYSHKVEKVSQPRTNRNSKRAHSKIVYARNHNREKHSDRYNRTPYMEQEYRRHWNEKLMFNERARRYSSEQPFSAEPRTRPVYYQNYEARSVMVDPKLCASGRLRQIPTNNMHYRASSNHGNLDWPRCQIERNLSKDTAARKSPDKVTAKGLAWFKKHKMGLHCGEQWKKFLLEG